MKHRFSSLVFEPPMVPSVVIEPQAKKDHGNEHAVDHDGRGQFEHRSHHGALEPRRQASSASTSAMKSEKEKMLAGELYNPLDPELSRERQHAREHCKRLNESVPGDAGPRAHILRALLGCETDAWIEPPFFCDYGRNISLGEKVFFNFNCVVLDVMPVRIGNHTLFGPAVQIYTAMHPIDADERRRGLEYARPVTIGSDVWVGGSAVICPGVTVGDRAVIGAGSVVTRDVPADAFAAGNPCRVVRSLR
jgi:maltose O-acetyltransferase